MSTPVGSVTAEIILDSKEFNEAIKKLREEVSSLKEVLKSNKGMNNLQKDVEKLKQQVESLTKTNEDYRKQLKRLREENKGVADDSKSNTNNLKKEAEQWKKSTETIKEHSAAQKEFIKNFDYFKSNTYNGVPILDSFTKTKKVVDEATQSVKRFHVQYSEALAPKKYSGIKADTFFNTDWEKVGEQLSKHIVYSDRLKLGIMLLGQEIKATGQQINRFAAESERAVKTMTEWAIANERTVNRRGQTFSKDFNYLADNFKADENALRTLQKLLNQTKLDWLALYKETNQYSQKFYAEQRMGLSSYKERIAETSAELRKLYLQQEKYYASVGAMSWKYWRQIRGSNEANNQVWNSDKTWNRSYFNAQSIGLQSYYANIEKVTTAIKKLKAEQRALAADRTAYSTANFERASQGLRTMNRELERNIALEKRRRSATYQRDEIAYSAQNFQKASAGMQMLNSTMEKYEKNAISTAENTRKLGRGITSFNNGIVQTAHSGRILSNTLYQIRGALLSVKMIATAMGGMALWGFAMEIAEGVKTTFTAKNELEAQLKQNAKVGQNGLRDFNKELDNTIKKFQKVNKYQLGETVSSLGVEFELNMKQMKKAMPIVAMIQSEYIRAGRTSEEAALAVKDILQGEFQRLSRETGVGKDELTKYGWSGDKTDIDSLLDAVKKAGEDRNWDIFAAKATSLNDVMEITKNRFEEFGADFLQTISPAVVSGFNMIIDTIDGLQKAFDGLGSFGKNFAIGGAFIGGLATIGTVLPMVTKGMGLAEIATLGWGKSLLTATFNLNKLEVGQYGLRKALAAVITGTKASELANVRTSKAILGRVLGVKQATLAEHGLISALVESKATLKGHSQVAISAAAGMGNLRQKLIYLANGTIVADKSAATYGKTLKALITSTKLWGLAIKGVIGLGVVAWFASLATWADAVKKRMDMFNDYIDNGKDKVSKAQKTLDKYNETLQGMSESDPNYALTKSNRDTAQHNLASITAANELAKQIKKNSEAAAEANDLMIKGGLNAIYSENGLKNVEKYGAEYQQMKYVAYDMAKAEEERYKFEYASLQHTTEHARQMKEAGIDEQKRIKYITEYSAKASEVAENLKKFNEGDLTAGAYYVIGRLQLMWIDLWNDKDFIVFWDTVKRTFHDIKPTLIEVKDALFEIGRTLMKFFSTEQGRWVGTIALAAGTFGILAWKLKGLAGPLKTAWGGLKNIGGKLKDLKDGWRKVGDEAEEATEKMGGSTSTGGIAGEGKGGKSWLTTTGDKLKGDATNYLRAAVAIAAGMLLITEAIELLQAPMWALARTGRTFKASEPDIRAGIEGLQLIAPIMMVLLPPVIALAYLFGKFDIEVSTILKGSLRAAVGIAAGMVLVAEAVYMLKAPMWAIAQLGNDYVTGKEDIQNGINAINATTEALTALLPILPVFAAGIALGVATFLAPEVMLLVDLGIVAGIAGSMLLVAEAVVTLRIPLEAIRELGNSFTDIEGAKKGAEVIKLTAEAMGYVEEATRLMAQVEWELLAGNIAKIINGLMGVDLSDLTGEGGYLTEIFDFVHEFNSDNLKVESPNTDKITALKNTATGIGAVGDAMQAVSDAMEKLPDEFKNGGNTQNPLTSYNSETGKSETTSATGYFDQFKQPLTQLGEFVTFFNEDLQFPEDGIDEAKLSTITAASNMITQVKTAVDNVKVAMQGIGDAGWATNMANGGIGAAISGWIMGLGGSTGGNGGGAGVYTSSLGSSFDEMESVIGDIITFGDRVNNLVGGSSGGDNSSTVTAMANMVTAVDQAIQNLSNTLSNAVPQIKGNAKAIGTGIHDGVKEGIGDLSATVKNKVITAVDAAKPVAVTYGKGLGGKLTEGFKSELKLKTTTETEINTTLTYLEGKKTDFYNKGYDLGDSVSRGYKNGNDMHSPGIIARSTQDELGYVMSYFDDALINLPSKAFELGNALSSSFNFDLNLGNFQLPDISTFQTNLGAVIPMVDDVKTQVSTKFGDMKTRVGTALSGIATNATQKYQQIVASTRTNMGNMQSATTKNITGIKTSWRGMQDALIASAEHIKTQTSAKINKLKSNMGSFWNKIKNPELLISGSAGPMKGTIRRPTVSRPRGLYAGGGTVSRSQSLFRPQRSTGQPSDLLEEYLKCLSEGKQCYAGWGFNWTNKINNKVGKWNTHFAKYHLDDFLNVGKFNNSNFPVKGRADVAKQYIFDVIRSTKYGGYFNSHFGDDPVAALRSGVFNCWDGTNIVLAIARAFGFIGDRVHGSWNGVGHVWASIPGLGIIDPTAIQQRGAFKATGAVNYGGGSKRPPAATNSGINLTLNVTINGKVEDAKETGEEIGRVAGQKIIDILRRSPSTGL